MKTGGKCIKYPCFCGFWYALRGGVNAGKSEYYWHFVRITI